MGNSGGNNGNKGRSSDKKGGRNDLLSALEMNGKGSSSFITKELRKLALLMRNVKREREEIAKPQVEDVPQTDNTPPDNHGSEKSDFSRIDEFIMAEGEDTSLSIDDIIRSGAPSGDYFSDDDYVADDSDSPSSQLASIDSFLTAVKNGELKNACSLPDDMDDDDSLPDDTDDDAGGIDESFFTESLAKIYIKQRRYTKALEIIRKLSLIYPEKNIYFADQIRFLEKLIDNIKTE